MLIRVGRPRTVSPSPEECIKLGEELLKWATERTGEFRFRFPQWYSIKKNIIRKDWKSLIQSPEFLPYYEKVQSIFADKCLTEYVKEGFANRYLRLYDRDLIEIENEQAKYISELKKQEQNQQNQKVIFEVNYKNDSNDSIEVLPKELPNSDTPSPE